MLMKRPLTPAYAYLRVSGKGQIDGDGFTRQLLAITAYAKQNGHTIVKVFKELGVKGTNELADRPALLELFGALEDNNDGLKRSSWKVFTDWPET